MNTALTFKPDFPKTAARFEAWWHGQIIDRPVVSLRVKPSRPYDGPVKQHATIRDRWFDTEYVVESAIAQMKQRDFLGDSIPCFCSNMGPDITATVFSCELEYGPHTSWSRPIIDDPASWRRLDSIDLNFANPYWAEMEKQTRLAIECSQGQYQVGMTDLHGNYDILAALRDPQMLCVDLMDCPDQIAHAALVVADAFNRMFDRQYALISSAGFGSTCWCPFYHNGPAYIPSCDFWCMVSDDLARRVIWPAIEVEMQRLDRAIFHLDGPQALRHLDLLLSCPKLNAIQWVYGAGDGPAAKWIDVYRRCQAAGKTIQVYAIDAHDALTVLEQLQPEGIWLHIGDEFEDIDQANRFLKEVERLPANR